MTLPTGAIPTSRARLAMAAPHRPKFAAAKLPDAFLALPTKMSYWLNNSDGDCVTAASAFRLAAQFAYGYGTAEIIVPDAEVKTWAKSHGALNGAVILDVLQWQAQAGFTVNGTVYNNGPPQAVDWTNITALQQAVFEGPVDVGVAASQLQSVQGIGGANGWFATGFMKDSNNDHCPALSGYGTATSLVALFNAAQPGLNMAVPSTLEPSTPGFALFTWDGVGFIDYASLVNIMDGNGEAWVCNPSVVGLMPTPGPAPGPTPTPTPGPAPGPTPEPDPIAPVMVQLGVYQITISATLNDPPPSP